MFKKAEFLPKNNNINTGYFAKTEMKSGDVISVRIDENGHQVAEKIQDSNNKVPYGVCIGDVVATVKNVFLQNPIGAKIPILTEGVITYWFDPSLKLPVFQPIYVDLENSSLTWKKLGPTVGYTTLFHDKDGYVKLKLIFSGQF